MSPPALALKRILGVLQGLGIRYCLGGSVASAIHGVARPTLDVDLVVDLGPETALLFATELKSEFYLDEDQILEALRRGRAFNLIHLESSYKFDFFPIGDAEWPAEQLSRGSKAIANLFGEEALEFVVASAEDVVIAKLQWYRAGGCSSERQWGDLRGVVAARGPRLDLAYLRRWATRLQVSDLLEKLLAESASEN